MAIKKAELKKPKLWFESILKPDLHDTIDDGCLRALAQVEEYSDFCAVKLFIAEYYVPQKTTVIEFLSYQMFFDTGVVRYLNGRIRLNQIKQKPGAIALNHPVCCAKADWERLRQENQVKEEDLDPCQPKQATWQQVNEKLGKLQMEMEEEDEHI